VGLRGAPLAAVGVGVVMIVVYIFPSAVVACILVFGGRRSRGRRRELPRLPETCPLESQRDFNMVRSSPVLPRPVYKHPSHCYPRSQWYYAYV
jgi:hypothetical protein